MLDWSEPFPETLAIQPLSRPPQARITVPGSKSITNRALVLAALAGGDQACELANVLHSEDTEVMIAGLKRLGFQVQASDVPPRTVRISRPALSRLIPASSADLFVANSGTTMRFLAAMVCLGQGCYRLDGVPRMRERPIEDLLAALRQLGVRAESEGHNGCPPVRIESSGLNGGTVEIRGDVSSQFLSGLLMAAPLARGDLTIHVAGPLVSTPYVAMTVAMMRQFGACIEVEANRRFDIPGRQTYQRRYFLIEPDASAASYFLGAAAISGGQVEIVDLHRPTLQGDYRFVELLERMGCQAVHGPVSVRLQGGPLSGIDVDMNDISDCVMTLAAVACFAGGPTTIRNVAHIRHKETDRLQALATELRRLGAGVDEFDDGLTIVPQPLHGAVIETYNDHRMAMSMALVGLRVPGVIIHHPACVAKTYPDFFRELQRLQ